MIPLAHPVNLLYCISVDTRPTTRKGETMAAMKDLLISILDDLGLDDAYLDDGTLHPRVSAEYDRRTRAAETRKAPRWPFWNAPNPPAKQCDCKSITMTVGYRVAGHLVCAHCKGCIG